MGIVQTSKTNMQLVILILVTTMFLVLTSSAGVLGVPLRIGVLTRNGELLVKEDALNAGWESEYTGVKDFQLEGNRIAVLLTNGDLLVKEGPLNAGWVKQYSNVRKFQLEGDRIGIIDDRGILLVKSGTLYSGWVQEWDYVVTKFQLEQTRIGILDDTHHFLVKEGGLSNGWVVKEYLIDDFQLFLDRIAVITQGDRVLKVKEGSLSSDWVSWDGMAPIRDVLLWHGCITVLDGYGTGRLYFQYPSLNSPWEMIGRSEDSSIIKFQPSSEAHTMLLRNGFLSAKYRIGGNRWFTLEERVKDYQYYDEGPLNLLGVLLVGDTFRIKDCSLGLSNGWIDMYSNVSKFQIICP